MTEVAQALAVSVIVPIRNEEGTIRQVLDRLLHQDTPPTEIILADGGSRDATKDIVREYIQAGHPIRLVEDADAFPGRARNLAIEQAATQWVAMTDAGTVIPPNWLGSLVRKAAERDGVDVVFGSYEPVLGSFFDECVALAFVPPAMNVGGLPYRGPTTASLLIRTDVWKALDRFPEHLRACEDLIFFRRLGESKWTTEIAPDAPVAWKIPAGFRGVFRRFRLYSFHTLRAGLGRTWHLALARNLCVAMLVVCLAVVHHWGWLAMLVAALGGRAYRSVRNRRPWLKLNHRIGLRSYFIVGIIQLWIDLAALAGSVEYVLRPRKKR